MHDMEDEQCLKQQINKSVAHLLHTTFTVLLETESFHVAG